MNRLLAAYRRSAVKSGKAILGRMGLSVLKAAQLEQLLEASRSQFDLKFVRSFATDKAHDIIDLFPASKAQLRQDVFALLALQMKKGGYFVEFGATDGVTLSNTFLLEKQFGWTGILAEPARVWRERLCNARECAISLECVWPRSGEVVEFCETPWSEISTSKEHLESDGHKGLRADYKSYAVRSISLSDLLKKHNAPQIIDYLSIDTEGSEFEILNNFPFEDYSFNVITCEHNYTENREKILALLSKNGYVRVLDNLSDFDDWYVSKSLRSDFFEIPT